MNNNRRFAKFLATFDGEQAPAPPPQVTPPVPAPPPAAVQSGANIPVEALPAIIDLATRRSAAQQRLEQVQQQTNTQSAPAPAAAPAPDQNADLVRQIAALTKQVAETNKRADAAALEAYRMQAIQSWKAQGVEVIEGMVGGRNQAEVDASLQVAAAEYQHLQNEWLKKQAAAIQQAPAQAPAPVAPPVMTPPPVPQGMVTQQAQPQQQFQQAPQQTQAPSVPGYMAAPNMPAPTAQGLDAATLQVLTSSDAVRNGSYAANRQQLLAQLRSGGAPGNGQPWAFNPQGPQLAPAMPVAQAPMQPGQQAMGANAYAGVSIPQVRQQHGVLGAPMQPSMNGYGPNYSHAPVQRAAPQHQNFGPQRAPQPIELDEGQAQLDGNSLAAAHSAAQSSIMGARNRAANLPPTH